MLFRASLLSLFLITVLLVAANEHHQTSAHLTKKGTSRSNVQRRRLQDTPCGSGTVGNGVCADTTLCCSQYGYCGSTSDYCGSNAPNSSPVQSNCGGGIVGNGVCDDKTLCCSKYGYCGNTSEYCANAAPTAAPLQGTCGGGTVGNAICSDTTLCCSKYGYCGNTSDYCDNRATTTAPVTTKAPIIIPIAPVTPYPTPAPVPTAAVKCGGRSDVMTINYGYYESWATYRNQNCNPVRPQDINVAGNKYTHLSYSFAGINASDYLAPSSNDYSGEVPKYIEFNALKKSNPGLKTFIAVGGATFNDPGPTQTLFSDISASATRRATFAASVVTFLQTYGFDGIDVDWEYPGDTNRGGRPDDFRNLPLLLKAIRDASAAAGRKVLITMAIPVNINVLRAGYDLAALSRQLDFFNIMAYDINGAWNNPPVVGSNTDWSYVEPSIQYMLKSGMPSNKMVLGLASYGRTFYLSDPNCNQPGCKFTSGGPGGCAGDVGYMPYFTIDQFVQSKNYSSLRFNPATSSMELVTGGNVWISFDNQFTLNIKASYAAANCMRGTMWWAIDLLSSPIVLDIVKNDKRKHSKSNKHNSGQKGKHGNRKLQPGQHRHQ